MLTMDALRQFGADVQDGLARCINDESFYLELVNMVLDDESFGALAAAVGADDRKAAFQAAHALKGVLANVSLTPLYAEVAEMTELLRQEKDADYPGFVDRILRLRNTLLSLREGG